MKYNLIGFLILLLPHQLYPQSYPIKTIQQIQTISIDSLKIADSLGISSTRWTLQTSPIYKINAALRETVTIVALVTVQPRVITYSAVGKTLCLRDTGEAGSNPFSGIYARWPGDSASAQESGLYNIKRGDIIQITGYIDEFPSNSMNSFTQFVPITTSPIEIKSSNNPIPPPLKKIITDFNIGVNPGGRVKFSTGEPYEAMEVEFSNLTVSAQVNTARGTWAITDENGNSLSDYDWSYYFTIGNGSIIVPGDPNYKVPVIGTKIAKLKGYIMTSSGAEAVRGYRICPTLPGDIVYDYGLMSSSLNINYGNVKKADSSSKIISIHNLTNDIVFTIDSVKIFGSNFKIALNVPKAVPVRDSILLSIMFKPSNYQEYFDTLYIYYGQKTIKVSLYGNSPQPLIDVNPTAIDFQNVEVDSSKTLSFVVTNNSVNLLLIDTMYTLGNNFTVMKVKDTVNIGTQKMVDVIFKPKTIQKYDDTLFIKNNTEIGILKLSLKGNSPKPSSPVVTSAIAGNKKNVIQWQPIVNTNVKNIKIYRDSLSPAVTLYDSMSSEVSQYKDSSVLNGKKYYYRLKAIHRTNVESEYSNEVFGYPYNISPKAVSLKDTTVIFGVRTKVCNLTYSSAGSVDQDGKIDSIHWYVNEKMVGTNENLVYDYPNGDSQILLIVKDNDGATDTSKCIVKIMSYKTQLNGSISGLSLLGDSILYVIASNDAIYRFNYLLKKVYDLKVGGSIKSSSSISSDTIVYIGSTDKNLYAFSRTGSPLWPAIPLGGELSATPTLDPVLNRLYVGVSNGNFYGINRSSGAVVWNFFVDSPILQSAILTSDRKLFFSSAKGVVYIIDLAITFNPTTYLWSLNLNDSITSSPAVDLQGNFYFGSKSGKLYKVRIDNSSSISVVWQGQTGGAITASPVIDATGTVYVGSNDKYLYAFDQITGTQKWSLETNGKIISAPALSTTGNLYFGNDLGEVFAIDTNRNILWRSQSNYSISTPLLYKDRTLFVGNDGGELSVFYEGADTNSLLLKSLRPVPIWGTFQGNNQRTGYQGDISTSSVVKNNIATPTDFTLSQNYPNPFNPATTIRYGLPTTSRVSLKVYNILGQQVANLVSTEQSAGWYERTWNADVSSGLYFYRIEMVSISDPNQRFTQLKKMVLLK